MVIIIDIGRVVKHLRLDYRVIDIYTSAVVKAKNRSFLWRQLTLTVHHKVQAVVADHNLLVFNWRIDIAVLDSTLVELNYLLQLYK